MAMSRKHYEAVAKAIRNELDIWANEQYLSGDKAYASRVVHDATRGIARELADTFASDNSRFDRQRFYRACGIED